MVKTYSAWLKQAKLLAFMLMVFCVKQLQAQSLLDKHLSVSFNEARLSTALNIISVKGGFYFSYNGGIIPKDSLVTLSATDAPVSVILGRLLKGRYAFEERKNYVIITRAMPHLSLINTDITNDNNTYSVSGFVIDETTGERLMNASVYEKDQLVSGLTDEHGYFKLRFHAPNPGSVAVTVSKRLYQDTTIRFLQTVSVNMRNDRPAYNDARDKNGGVERTAFGRMFISGRQMIQSMNIPDFFARRPFQVSLTPGLSSHGMFSSQVVNKFSVNLLGGYTAGVNGFEIGGLFNINKLDSRYLQLAGLFNLVGGRVTGAQIALVDNIALDTVRGLQFAGFINKAESDMHGMQIAALYNETHKLKGVQIGLFNAADTSLGASIGLVNIIRNGFYRVAFSANDLTNTNVSLATGNHNFYSKLQIGVNTVPNKMMYAVGLGIGHDFMLGNKFYVSTEAAFNFANTGNFDDRWWQGKLLLNAQISKHISLFAGPVYNSYNHSGTWHTLGYKNVTNLPDYPDMVNSSHQTKNWLGWEAGIALNSVFKPVEKKDYYAKDWYLGIATIAGAGDTPYQRILGAEVFAQRDLSGGISGTLSVGYTNYHASYNTFYYIQPDEPNTDRYNNFNIIPVKAGVRTYLSRKFFFAGEIGEAFGLNSTFQNTYVVDPNTNYYITKYIHNSFLYSVSAGYSFTNGLEAGLKYESYTNFPSVKQLAFRFGYRFKLGK